jgi:fucose permease
VLVVPLPALVAQSFVAASAVIILITEIFFSARQKQMKQNKNKRLHSHRSSSLRRADQSKPKTELLTLFFYVPATWHY